MNVLIVEHERALSLLWRRHIERQGMRVWVAHSQDEAITRLMHHPVDVIILNLVLPDGSAFAISDFASYRCPSARVIFVTQNSFFSDGSIFALANNACALVQTHTPPEDLAALVEHHALAQ